ncbi:D-alanyl-D-alanine carboxypeptidase/D-alanyl-D-alanine-endopeptidase [Rhodobacteraceae bacterium CCMM004]|nr:D-alanyl-D-alanine carboxypeptidase/D-alanyl-D-alanine-endopeptidase [Rhodobacteraceae bacterium CCMM004]
MVTRREVIAGLCALGAAPAWAEAPERSIRPAPRAPDFYKTAVPSPESLIADARLGGKVSFVVADARTGRVLESHKPLLPQPPASTAKALTALYGLDTLGADHRYETRLIATGPLENGRIDGDLVLAGGGDPTLDTDGLAELAAALKDAGLREVGGAFRIWTGALPEVYEIDVEQPDHVGYNPALGGLNLNFNRVHFEWKRGGGSYTVTMDARSAKYRPRVSMAQMRVVNRKVPIYTYENGGDRDQWTVAQAALGDGGARWLPVRRPGLYAGEVFQSLARSHGIALGGIERAEAAPRGTTLASRASPPLTRIVRDMLKYSTNSTAEIVGMSASHARDGDVAALPQSATIMNAWLQTTVGLRSVSLEDHSGLGDDSRITARDMVTAMVKNGPDGPLADLMKGFDVSEAAPNATVRAKTGTLNFVSALAGFVTQGGQPPLAFAIFCADTDRRDALTVAQRERPEGGRAWARRARSLQRELIARWSVVHSA